MGNEVEIVAVHLTDGHVIGVTQSGRARRYFRAYASQIPRRASKHPQDFRAGGLLLARFGLGVPTGLVQRESQIGDDQGGARIPHPDRLRQHLERLEECFLGGIKFLLPKCA